VLQIQNLSKSFDGVQAVQDVSLSIQAGKITSLIGPNGAGKTTLFNVVTGFLQADHGTVKFKDHPLNSLSPWRIVRAGVARTFQNLRLFRKLTVLENVLLGIKGQRGEQFLNALFQFSHNSTDHTRSVKRAEELIDFVGLSTHRNELADNLSYGQQKLLSIACCLAGDPELLLLDEPVAGVQPEMIKKIEGLIKELVEKQNRTVFLIEHDIDFVLRISDTVVVMDDGRKIVEDKPESIRNNSAILEAYLS
jgi:ABC-type branched-subunit amino acid transport system ATPase component